MKGRRRNANATKALTVKGSENKSTQGKKPKKETSLLDSFSRQLEGSKFRYINEVLYTSRGDQAVQLFKEKPQLFDEYHSGYEKQVESWPVNPLDVIISHIKSDENALQIVDMGCGEARLSEELSDRTVRSFDLVAHNNRVEVANISKVPVKKGWADVVVFCLSLMGTDFHLFLKEGFRILKTDGLLYIAEPVSRIKSVNAFIHGIEALGFVKLEQEENKVFVLLTFRKNAKNYVLSEQQMEALRKKVHLLPCLYKKR